MKTKSFFWSVIFLFVFVSLANAQTSYQNLSRDRIDTDQLPVRDVRKVAVWLNMGWNGLVGFGPAISFYPVPKIAIDGGLGISGVGVKVSARGRYLFSVKNFTPFVGLGFQYGLGSGADVPMTDSFNNNKPFSVKVSNSPFIQVSGGFEYMAKRGFFTLFNIGYAILLKDNYEITDGNPSPDELKVLDISYGSGIVLEGGIGYAF